MDLPALAQSFGLPLALCIVAIVALARRADRHETALIAGLAERVAIAERRLDDCDRDRSSLRIAMTSHIETEARRTHSHA